MKESSKAEAFDHDSFGKILVAGADIEDGAYRSPDVIDVACVARAHGEASNACSSTHRGPLEGLN